MLSELCDHGNVFLQLARKKYEIKEKRKASVETPA
jgi:hypothetical protein